MVLDFVDNLMLAASAVIAALSSMTLTAVNAVKANANANKAVMILFFNLMSSLQRAYVLIFMYYSLSRNSCKRKWHSHKRNYYLNNNKMSKT